MIHNNIVAAPQTGDAMKLYEEWKRDHYGSMADFIQFLCTPSAERRLFLSRSVPEPDVEFIGEVATVSFTPRV